MEEIHNSSGKLASGWSASLSLVVGTSIMVIDKKEILVNGYNPKTSTVYQFYGCKWHGCPCLAGSDVMSNDKCCKTIHLENRNRSLGYKLVSVWECQNPEFSRRHLQREFVPYPHYIVFDFEAVLRRLNLGLTFDVKIDCSHIPVSKAINDSLTNESIFIENRDPERLIEEFVAELNCRQGIILRELWNKYPMIDKSSLPKQVRERRINWVNQVPVFVFNSGKYDLNLVKEHFVWNLPDMNDVTVVKKDNSYMFVMTPTQTDARCKS